MEISLAEELCSNINAGKLEFSREISQSYGDVKLLIPINDALVTYKDIQTELNDFSSNFDKTFISRGIDNITNILLPRGTESFMINAHAASVISELLEKFCLPKPVWLPETFKTDEKKAEHQRTCYFKWNTVNPSYIPHTMEGFMKLKLAGSIKSASKKTVTESQIKDVIEQPVNSSKVDSDELCKEAVHGRFVAKKYLWLIDSASKRNLEFSISIEELSNVLRDHICYYTKATLVSFPHEKGENNNHLPDNYLTIDRKDNDAGYIPGNVVSCSKEINELKNQMSEQDFQQTIALKTLMKQANLSPEQLNAFTVLMKSKS